MRRSAKILFAVSLYWVVSISLVFMNKYLLSSPELKLDAPIFITWFQCVVSLVLCLILSQLAKLNPRHITFPEFRPSKKILLSVLPLSVVFLAMISFNNLCLKYVGVSFYFVGRSLTTVFNVLFTYFILHERTSRPTLICCAAIVGGFWLGVDQENLAGELSWRGVFYGVAGSVAVALNAIYTKKVLAALEDCVWQLTMYNNLLACFLLLPVIVVNQEVGALMSFKYIFSSQFWLVMLTSGVFGFGMGYVTGLQIKVTSPLTHNVSGTAKSCMQTVIAYVANGEHRSFLWWFSNAVVLLGSFAYTMVRRGEMRSDDSKKLPTTLQKV